MITKRLHVFKAGPQTSAQGVERNFTPTELQEVVESYDPGVHEAPLVIGHSGDNDSAPSFGWIKKFVRQGENLYADVNFTDAAKDLVKNGHYRKVSISFYSPESPVNPHQGKWSARHLALLGASPPAVKGLEAFSFTEEDGVFNFAAALTLESLVDEAFGPTLIVEKSPLEMLREKIALVKGESGDQLQQLAQSQNQQSEVEVGDAADENEADQSTAPQNPNQQFSEMKKKMGHEGAEVSESAQSLANMETKSPDHRYEEDTLRKKAKGAHGHQVQVVEEVFEEDEEHETPKKKLHLSHKKGHSEEEFGEITEKETKDGKVTFKSHPEEEDPTGRGETARSLDDSYAKRQSAGKGKNDGREDKSSNDQQDRDRVNTAKNSEQEENRKKLSKNDEETSDNESRWADQPEAKGKAMTSDQYADPKKDLPESVKPGTSDPGEPYGRAEGPTETSEESEEDPDDMELAVDLENVRDSKDARVLYNTKGKKRAPVLGGDIADHAEEEEADGVTRTPRKAGVSSGKSARGRSGGPTDFPTRSEEEPDDMELAVDLEDATESPRVRIVRQKAGEEPEISYLEDEEEEDIESFGEKQRSPFTKTGKGSTYGQKSAEMEDDEEEEEDDAEFMESVQEFMELMNSLDDDDDYSEEEEEDYSESLDYCGMGSIGQPRAMGFPPQMYEELMNLKNENERLRKEYEEHKTRSRKEKIAQFIENLYAEGKLTDGIMPQRELQNYCESLELGTLEFAEGETPTTKLFALLDRLPNLVYFGEVVESGVYHSNEEEEMDPHQQAIRMVERGEASDYVEAIKRCIPWGTRG